MSSKAAHEISVFSPVCLCSCQWSLQLPPVEFQILSYRFVIDFSVFTAVDIQKRCLFQPMLWHLGQTGPGVTGSWKAGDIGSTAGFGILCQRPQNRYF